MVVETINIDIPFIPNKILFEFKTPVSPKNLLSDDDYKSQVRTLKIAGVEAKQFLP